MGRKKDPSRDSPLSQHDLDWAQQGLLGSPGGRFERRPGPGNPPVVGGTGTPIIPSRGDYEARAYFGSVTMTTTLVKPDENKNKRKKEAKNETSGNAQLGFLEKNDSAPESSQKFHKTDTLETILKDTGKEINALLSKYAQILSERAAMDASYVEELEGILKEACSIEHHLKLKRENLRHSFAAIAGPLQNEEGLSGK